MALLCRVIGHKWQGCRCTRCGAVRDGGHPFILAEGKCERTCPLCGKTEEAPHQWHHCACTHCGQTRDKHHDWIATTECEDVCRICGKERTHHDYLPAERGVDKCRRCGKLHRLSPEEIQRRDEEWDETVVLEENE